VKGKVSARSQGKGGVVAERVCFGRGHNIKAMGGGGRQKRDSRRRQLSLGERGERLGLKLGSLKGWGREFLTREFGVAVKDL